VAKNSAAVTRIASRAVPALAGALALWAALAVARSPLELGIFAVLALLFTAPGWPLARWVGGRHLDLLTRTILAWTLGSLAGGTICSILRLAGVSAPAVALGACMTVAAVLAWAVRRRREGLVPFVRLGPTDAVALGVLWLIAVAIVGPVFARVGDPTPAGLAYRAYFNADLFVHMGVVAELAKGAAPPLNPYYPHEPLPYYWSYFTLPALFSQLRPALLVDRGILLTDTATALTFVSVAYLVLRNLAATPLAAALSWATIVLASSFEGVFFLWRQAARDRPFEAFRYTNMDAITRWLWNLPSLDGFHRAMWWTPQHELALALTLMLVLVMVRAPRVRPHQAGLFEGLLLGGVVATSSFNGVLIVAGYAVGQLAMLALDRGADLRAWLAARAVAALVVAGFAGLVIALGIVQFVEGSFVLGWNPHFLRGPWAFVLLNFGPALFLAPLGLAALLRSSTRLAAALAGLLAVAIGVFLLVDLHGHENTQVAFRTGQIAWLVLAVLLAFAIDTWRTWRRAAAAGLFALLALGAAAALPTVALDWYNAHDISNVAMSPGGFPWTVHVNAYDFAAAHWIQDSLPLDATVQTDAAPRGRYTWALVPAFLRRRMATGNGIAELNPGKFTARLEAIHAAFGTLPAGEAHRFFREIGADYLYVGDVERRVHGMRLQKFRDDPQRFRRVFGLGSVEIFQVVK
jgi:hypothetical protein